MLDVDCACRCFAKDLLETCNVGPLSARGLLAANGRNRGKVISRAEPFVRKETTILTLNFSVIGGALSRKVSARQGVAFGILCAWLSLAYSSCQQPTSVNQPVISDSTIYVIERDHLNVFADQAPSGVYSFPVVNFHETYLINNSTAPVSCTVESPLPDTLKRESIQSPLFGGFAYIPLEYSDFFDLPNVNDDSLADKPNVTTANSYIWKDMKLDPSEGIHLAYSSYYGEESMFIKNFGTNHFLDMDVVSDYSIQKDSVNPNCVDIEIKQTLQNTSSDSIYRIGFLLFVPRELETKFAPPNGSEWTTLYDLISDTVISPSSNKCYLYNTWFQNEGFGFPARGQEMNPSWFVLPPYQSFQFVFKMTIQPLLDKFEIYPSYAVNMTIKGDPIWPSSVVTVNGKKYDGQVHYLKQCSLGMPTYILFSIDNGTLKVVSPNEIVPTFIPPYIKPEGDHLNVSG